MKKTLRQHFEEVCKKNECAYTDEYLLEHLIDREIKEIDRDKHRWYYLIESVSELLIDDEQRFFRVDYPEATGDTYIEWEEWEIPAEEYVEVYPRTKTIEVVEYLTKEEL